MKKVCFTAISDNLYYPEGTHIMINSFRRWHPDVDLIIFRQDTVDKLFKDKNINWYQCKPYFAELLMNDYDLVVNIDADTVICGRLSEVFDKVDYEVGAAWNFNDYENSSFLNITEEMYLQAGMVASTSKEFWLKWQEANKEAMEYLRKENDTLNLVVYNEMPELKLKIFDKAKDYYGCKSLGRELEFRMEGDKLMCRGEQVLAYHFARGGTFPKLDFDNMPLVDEVKEFLKGVGYYGQTVKYV